MTTKRTTATGASGIPLPTPVQDLVVNALLPSTRTARNTWEVHLSRLQILQSVCENLGDPYTLTLRDLFLAMNGLDHYFAQRLEARQQTVHEVKQSLYWAEEVFSWEASLEDDVIQVLSGWIGEARYQERKVVRARAS